MIHFILTAFYLRIKQRKNFFLQLKSSFYKPNQTLFKFGNTQSQIMKRFFSPSFHGAVQLMPLLSHFSYIIICKKLQPIILLKSLQLFVLVYMNNNKKLADDPTMVQIKGLIKPAYFAEVENAVEKGDEDQIWKALKKFLRKREAEDYFPKIILAKRKFYDKGKIMKGNMNFQSKKKICEYLKQSLDESQYQIAWGLLNSDKIRESKAYLEDVLRFEEYEEVLPHLQRLQKDVKLANNFISNPEEKMVANKNSLNQDILNGINRQRIKNKLLMEIQEQLGNNDLFNSVNQYLEKGKLKKVEKLLKQQMGKRVSQQFMKRIRQEYVQKVNKPLQNAAFLHKSNDGINFYQIQTQQTLEIPQDEIVNILVVGMTGVGKSTFLNSLINYLLDIDMEDDFRYIVTRDMFKNSTGKSSTDKVHIYGIPKQGKMKKAFRLIDIPGLGDAGGIQKDRENLKKIKQRIEMTVPYINQIVYIFKSSQVRITKQTEYVIGQVMGMFAKDIEQSISFVLTFADNDQPRVLGSLNTTFSDLIAKMKEKNKQWYFKVNNSALFKKIDVSQHIDTTFYAMGQNCLQKIVEVMHKAEKVSMSNTIIVMSIREQLQQSIKALDEQLKASANKQEQIKTTIKDLALLEENSRKIIYKYKIKEQVIDQIPTDKNVMNCLNCKFPCHQNCQNTENAKKRNCTAMQNGFCKICPGKCSWQSHVNMHSILRRKTIEVEKTNDQLLKQYNIEKDNKNKKEQLLLDLITDYSTVIANIKEFTEDLQQKNNELSQLQLRKVNHGTVVQYIDILMIDEQRRREPGYIQRVRELNQIKNEESRLQKLFSDRQDNQNKKFQQIIQQRIKLLLPDKQMARKLIEKVLKNYQQIQIHRKIFRQFRKCRFQVQAQKIDQKKGQSKKKSNLHPYLNSGEAKK